MALFPPGASQGQPRPSTPQALPQAISYPSQGQGGAGGRGVVSGNVGKPAQQQTPPVQAPSTFMQMQQQGMPRPSPQAYTPQQGGVSGTNPYMGGSPNGVSVRTQQQPFIPPETMNPGPGGIRTSASSESLYNPNNPQIAPRVSTGGSTAQGPGSTAPHVTNASTGQQIQNPMSAQPAQGQQSYAQQPVQGNYTNPANVGAANQIGTGMQSLLNGQLGNPNPYANSPFMQSAGNLAMGQAQNPNPYSQQLNSAWGLANRQGQQINPYLGSSLTQGSGQAGQNLLADPMSPYAQGGMANMTQQSIQQQLQNPNPYNAQNVQQMMQVLQQPILEQQQKELSANEGNMAQRGLSFSGINEGQINDINTTAGRQQLSMADTLAQNIAQAQMQGTNSAIGNAAGYEGQLANQYLGGLGLGGQLALGTQGQLAGQWQTGINSAIGNQAGLQNQLFSQNLQGTNSAIQNNAGLQNQLFGQNLSGTNSALQNALGYGGQQYQQSYDTAGLNMQQDQMNNSLLMQMLGAS